ncbi:MAG: transporter, partial [Haloarcula sp.]
NLVIFGYVIYYARDVFGRIPLEPRVAAYLTVGLGVSFALTTGVVAGLTRAGLSPIVVASVAAVTCLVGFGGFLAAVSAPARLVATRTATLWRGRVRSLFG